MRSLSETEKEVYDEMLSRLKEQADGPVFLSEYVREDMIAKGFDPINKDDITAYWMSKGIEDTNG